MKQISFVSNIFIFAKELQQTSSIYTVCLGFKIKFMNENLLELEDARGLKISYLSVNNFAQQTKGYSPVISFKVTEFDDVIKQLKTYGALQEGETKDNIAYFKFPNDEMISIIKDDQQDDDEQATKQQTQMEIEIEQLLRKIKI
ncbi:hypothetical protein pb186bvf_010707 [Paramecium bursaria]